MIFFFMYENSYKRGTIHFVRMDGGVGSEEGAFRPGVVISSDAGNNSNPTVVVAYMTSQPKGNGIYFDTIATGKRSWVLTNQLATVDKRRLGKVLGELDGHELGLLDDALLESLGIDEQEDPSHDLIGDLTRQLDEEKAAHDAKIESYKIEIAMWQRLYEKALGTLVDMKFEKDLIHRSPQKPAAVVVEAPAPVEPVVEAPVEPEPEPEVEEVLPVDVNNCTITQLKKVGFTATVARLIIGCRPYSAVSDLEFVPGMKKSQLERAEKLLYCTVEQEPEAEQPVVQPTPGKLNINTATKEEIIAVTGMSPATAQCVVSHRQRFGEYTCLEDLLNVTRFGKGLLKRCADKLEV